MMVIVGVVTPWQPLFMLKPKLANFVRHHDVPPNTFLCRFDLSVLQKAICYGPQ